MDMKVIKCKKKDEKIIMQLMTFDDLLSELRSNEDDDTTALYKYDYDKFFKIYSRLAWNDNTFRAIGDRMW